MVEQEIESVAQSDEVVKYWAIASGMRNWLVQKKKNIAERVSRDETYAQSDTDAVETELLEEIIKKIQSKAKLLVALRPPKHFKSQEALGLMRPLEPKRSGHRENNSSTNLKKAGSR